MSVISSLLGGLFALMRTVFGVVQLPFAGLPAFVGILFWSVVSAIGVLLVYKKTSNQEGLDAVKRKIHACVFEIRLFNDDLRAILRAQAEIILHNLGYLRLSFKPMIWLIPPLVLIISQLHYFYGFRGLEQGETALLRVVLSEDWAASQAAAAGTTRPPLSLQLPDGLQAETEGVWTPDLNEMVWRLAAGKWGEYDLGVSFGNETYTKRISVSQQVVQVNPTRPESSILGQLEFPGEPPLPAASPLEAISVAYPEAEVWCLGLTFQSQWAWMILYFVLTMVFAFALRGPFGVTI